jgi:hypothetical protein
MADRDTLEQLFSTYAWAMDARSFDLFDEVFTTDASFVVSIAGGDTYGPFEGRAAVADFIGSTTQAQTDQRRHVIVNVRTVGDDKATALLSLHVVDNGVLTVKSCGVYTVTLGEEDGTTKFTSMDLALDLGF